MTTEHIMDDAVTALTKNFGDQVQDLLDNARREVRNDFLNKSEGFNRKNDILAAELSKLKDECSRLQSLLNRTEPVLRNQPDFGDTRQESADVLKFHQETQVPFVAMEEYQKLQADVGKLIRERDVARKNATRYQLRCKGYKGARERDRAAIKSWQNYHDALMNSKSDAHQNLDAFIQKVESCPEATVQRNDAERSVSPTWSPSASYLAPSPTSRPRTPTEQTRKQYPAGPSHQGFLSVPEQSKESVLTTTAQTYRDQDRHLDPMVEEQKLKDAENLTLPEAARCGESSCRVVWDDNNNVRPNGDDVETAMPSSPPGPSSPLPRQRDRIIRSSQSTDEGSEIGEMSPGHQNPAVGSDDGPELISVRSLKRKRNLGYKAQEVNENGAIFVKDEGHSSPLPTSAYVPIQRTQESIDLDEIPRDYTTPRKNRHKDLKFASFIDRAPPPPHLRRERWTSEPATFADMSQLPEESLQRRDVEYEVIRHLRSSQEAIRKDFTYDVDGTNIPAKDTQSGSTSSRADEPQADQFTHSDVKVPLRQLSTNTPLLPRTSESRPLKRRRRDRDSMIAEIAEDGESYTRSCHRQDVEAVVEAEKTTSIGLAARSRRLNELLDMPYSPARILTPIIERKHVAISAQADSYDQLPSAKKAVTSKSKGNVSANTIGNHAGGIVTPAQQITRREVTLPATTGVLNPARRRLERLGSIEGLAPSPQHPPAGRQRTTSRPLSPNRRMAEQQAIDKPVLFPTAAELKEKRGPRRSMALDKLRLDDFKINPSANFGHNYAYEEVNRGRQKACLPGCTRSDCCGDKFKKLVEIMNVPVLPRGLWDPTSSQDQETEDDRLLREQMGYNDGLIKQMSAAEKAKQLLAAKAKVLAGKFGKHKEQWARDRSPPGYWRTGFPTTQQAECDRIEAEKRITEEIACRRREALRKGGRWKFVDE